MSTAKFAALTLSCALAIARATPAHACTAFSAPTPEGPLVAKSFDWQTGEGWLVYNERQRTRTMLYPRPFSPTVRWTARYASLALTTVGPGFPIGGMNEAGLVVESLVDLSRTPALEVHPGALTGLEFVQYALDNFANVDELARFAQQQRVEQLAVALHFLACDRTGACIVIEGDHTGLEVTRRPSSGFQALANLPLAEDEEAASEGLASWLGFRPKKGSSSDRFARVARGRSEVRGREQAFSLLEQVASRATRWQVVWEPADARVFFRDHSRARPVVSFELEPTEACDGPPRVQRIGRGQEHGPVLRWSDHEARLATAQLSLQIPGDRRTASRLTQQVLKAMASSHCAKPE